MNIPFSIEQFLDVMARYNSAVWPFQIVLNLLAILVIILVFKKTRLTDKITALILSFLWIWTGVVYQLIYFTSINNAAWAFAVLFIVQGIIFIYAGILKQQFSFKFNFSSYNVTGAVFILYALIIYPLLGLYFGHTYPKSPTFGLPCPTVIFTFGVFLLSEKTVPKYVLIIPLLWSVIGFSAAVNLTIYEDFGLFIAGVSGTTLLIIKGKSVAVK